MVTLFERYLSSLAAFVTLVPGSAISATILQPWDSRAYLHSVQFDPPATIDSEVAVIAHPLQGSEASLPPIRSTPRPSSERGNRVDRSQAVLLEQADVLFRVALDISGTGACCGRCGF